MRRTFPSRKPLRLAALAAVLAGCSEKDLTQPAAAPQAPAGPAETIARDPAIDPNDTYIYADVTLDNNTTVYLAQPVYDTYSGGYTTTLSLTQPAETQTVEAGYDAYDQVRFNIYNPADGRDPTTSDADGVGAVRTVATNYSLYDQSGALMPVQYPSGSVTESPLAALGSLVGADITAGMLVDYGDTQPGTPRPFSAPNATLAYPDENTLRVTVPMDPAPGSTATTTSNGRGEGRGGSMVRTYKRHGNKWVIDEVNTELRAVENGVGFETHQRMRFSNVRWHLNPDKDARRRAHARPAAGSRRQLSTTAAVPLRNGTQRVIYCPVVPDPDYPNSNCPPPDDGGGDPPPPPPPPPPGANIVLQHGINSDSTTWNRMDAWLSSSLRFATKLKPSMPGRGFANLHGQGDILIDRIQNTGQNDFVLVGHSQGGLVSRDVAQRRPDLARGVVTIGTPHLGAALANTSRGAVSSMLGNELNRLYYGCPSPYADPGCYISYLLNQSVAYYVLDFAADAALPATGDLQPGSPYLQALNSTPEYFTRVGIQSFADRRWVLMRLAGDLLCNPESACGGRAFVSYTSWAYNGFAACSLIAGYLGYYDVAQWCFYVVYSLARIDAVWNHLTAPGNDRTDGIVQGSSQVYPNANRQYPINRGDSHVGEPKSDKVRTPLQDALTTYFQVPRQ